MAIKRKRGAEVAPKGLAPGERLKRHKLDISDPEFGWVHSEIRDASKIRDEHLQAACGFHQRNAFKKPVCKNKYATPTPVPARANGLKNESSKPDLLAKEQDVAPGEDEIIHISDDDDDVTYIAPQCSKRACKANPNCLNYLGQEKWLDEGIVI